jgi:hypothetical protein
MVHSSLGSALNLIFCFQPLLGMVGQGFESQQEMTFIHLLVGGTVHHWLSLQTNDVIQSLGIRIQIPPWSQLVLGLYRVPCYLCMCTKKLM